MLNIEKRFLSKVTIDATCGCWNWKGSCFDFGYGRFHVKSKSVLAHRWAYSFYKGEIPDKMCVCHTCDNPKCANPDHLFLGTPKTNAEDKVIKNRQARGEKIRKLKLNKEQASEIISSDKSLPDLAKQYGVSYGVIWGIKRKKYYKWAA